MGEVIVITSGKGGVGKTTTTANVGSALALRGKKVVLVDTDIGLRNLDVVMGLENRIVYDIVDVVEEKCKLRQALIKDKRFTLKVFQKNKDIDLYSYFSPKTREYLFSSFSHSGAKLEKLEELPEDTKSAILSKYPCTIFEYKLKEDIQGKAEEKGIFFFEERFEIH